VLLNNNGTPDDATDDVMVAPGDPGYKSGLSSGWAVAGYGAYVDLGYLPAYSPPAEAPRPQFHHLGDPRSRLAATDARKARVYDTWSFHYEHDGLDQDGQYGADQGTNGFDDDNNGVVDGPEEREAPPPYPAAMTAIRIKIRVFERDSRQIREVTVVQDFMPK